MPKRSKTVPIKDIAIGERHRKDVGDLAPLAESIRTVGLLHPPVITTSHELVCGFRRIEAAWSLGWEEIEVRVIDPEDLLDAERDENEVRKDFTVSERVAIGKAIEARIGSRRGQRTDRRDAAGGLRQKVAEVGADGDADGLRQKIAEVEPGKRTKEVAAEKAGFGNRETYRQASEVVEKGDPDTVEAMDRGEISVKAAHDRVAPKVDGHRSRVNGVLAEDPKEVARQRARGTMAEGIVPEVTTGDREATAEPGPTPAAPELSEEEWLDALPLTAKLSGTPLKVFTADARVYRRIEAARAEFKPHAEAALSAGRKGEFAYYLLRFLAADHPKHWHICALPEGCGGSGSLPGLDGTCPKCFGRGYALSRKGRR